MKTIGITMVLAVLFCLDLFIVADASPPMVAKQSVEKNQPFTFDAIVSVTTPAAATDTRFIGYAGRCTASVPRLDGDRQAIQLPAVPARSIGHIPLTS